MQPVRFHQFVDGKWIESTTPRPNDPPQSHISKILTYNILVKPLCDEHRIPRVIDVIRKADPDVVALQEVNKEHMPMILGDEYIRSTFFVSDMIDRESFGSNLKTKRFYGMLVLSKSRPDSATSFERNDLHLRNFIMVDYLSAKGRPLRLCSAHLNSCRIVELSHRPECLAFIAEQARTLPLGASGGASSATASSDPLPECDVMMLGDMNMHWPEEDRSIPEGYVDVWKHLNPDDPGYTYDQERNAILRRSRDGRFRLDRVFFNSPSGLLAPTACVLVGVEEFCVPDFGSMAPSDHFGILTTLSPTS